MIIDADIMDIDFSGMEPEEELLYGDEPGLTLGERVEVDFVLKQLKQLRIAKEAIETTLQKEIEADKINYGRQISQTQEGINYFLFKYTPLLEKYGRAHAKLNKKTVALDNGALCFKADSDQIKLPAENVGKLTKLLIKSWPADVQSALSTLTDYISANEPNFAASVELKWGDFKKGLALNDTKTAVIQSETGIVIDFVEIEKGTPKDDLGKFEVKY